MTDLVTDYASRSLAAFLESSVFTEAYVVTPDFDWDKKPHPINLNKLANRETPYAAVLIRFDDDMPFSVSANILYERNIEYHVVVCGSSHTNMMQKTADMRQALRTAVSATSGVGINLYDFAAPSGSFYTTAGTMQVELAQSQYFGAADQSEEGNRKFRSITPVSLTMFKDATARLLENKGRITLTDS